MVRVVVEESRWGCRGSENMGPEMLRPSVAPKGRSDIEKQQSYRRIVRCMGEKEAVNGK